jgi:hypothetical protein
VLTRLTSVFLGMLVCWLLNIVQLGIAFFLLSRSEKLLPAVYTLAAAIGLVQVGYVIPLWRYLRRRGLRDVAMGLLMAACTTLVVNAIIDYHVFGPALFR